MIHCTFCDELATMAFDTRQLLAWGDERISFCRHHLVIYYLGLQLEAED